MPSIIDLTQTLSGKTIVDSGDITPRLYQTKQLDKDGYVNFFLSAEMHTGTHIDGPMHMTDNRTFISDYSPDHFCGRGILFDCRGEQEISLQNDQIDSIQPGDVVLFLTGHDELLDTEDYFLQHPVITVETAQILVKKKIKIVGIDAPSPDFSPYLIHQILLKNCIFIIENLTNLIQLKDLSNFEIMAFPLKIEADSSPVRVLAHKLL